MRCTGLPSLAIHKCSASSRLVAPEYTSSQRRSLIGPLATQERWATMQVGALTLPVESGERRLCGYSFAEMGTKGHIFKAYRYGAWNRSHARRTRKNGGVTTDGGSPAATGRVERRRAHAGARR